MSCGNAVANSQNCLLVVGNSLSLQMNNYNEVTIDQYCMILLFIRQICQNLENTTYTYRFSNTNLIQLRLA